MMSSPSSVDPMEFFVEQVAGDDVTARVQSMRKLKMIGDALGREETLSRLIPFLNENVDGDDEILLSMASELGKFVPGLVPGPRAFPIITILEQLAAVEETVVRDKAIASINVIVPFLEKSDAPALLSMIKRLVNADWFTSKVSACGVFHTVYKKLASSEGRREMRSLFKELSEDETPMVRRSAARNFGPFVEMIEQDHVISDMLPVFRALCNDESDSVRQLAIGGAHSIAKALTDPGINSDTILPIVRNASNDLSWRVRNNLAKGFSDIVKNMGVKPSDMGELFRCYSSLLRDNEAEVRAGAVIEMAKMTQLGGSHLFVTFVADTLPSLAEDGVMEVRSKLAQSIMACVEPSICGKLSDSIILKSFTPIFESFLSDEYSEVQLHILNNLSRVSHLLSKMDGIVNKILDMTSDKNWRVKKAVAILMPFLAESMGVAFFEGYLLDSWMKLLQDRVADVRSAIVISIIKLSKVTGPDWIQKEILPRTKRVYANSTSYLTRVTIIGCYVSLASNDASHRQLQEELIGLLLKSFDDNVPNVRMISAKGLRQFSHHCDDTAVVMKIKTALTQRIAREDDDDCKYFSQMALDDIVSFF
mmetsp:Transcript_46689/g.91184  ORF Transcript_46689/g.91184 Transcript_46689/m.91184 type:complete len:592 (-) Transcript_46689:204-1979(-)